MLVIPGREPLASEPGIPAFGSIIENPDQSAARSVRNNGV